MTIFFGPPSYFRHRFRLVTVGMCVFLIFGCWWIAQDVYPLPAFSPLASVGAPAAIMLAMLGPLICMWPWLRHGTTIEILYRQRLLPVDIIWAVALTTLPSLSLFALGAFGQNDLLLSSARNYLGAIGIYMLWLSIGWRTMTPLVLVMYVIGISFFGPSRQDWFVFWPLHHASELMSWIIALVLLVLGLVTFGLGGHVRRITTQNLPVS